MQRTTGTIAAFCLRKMFLYVSPQNLAAVRPLNSTSNIQQRRKPAFCNRLARTFRTTTARSSNDRIRRRFTRRRIQPSSLNDHLLAVYQSKATNDLERPPESNTHPQRSPPAAQALATLLSFSPEQRRLASRQPSQVCRRLALHAEQLSVKTRSKTTLQRHW